MNFLKTGRTGTAVGSSEELVPAPILAAEFHVTRRTLGRWLIDQELNFPKPLEINGRLYFRRSETEAWKVCRHCASAVAWASA